MFRAFVVRGTSLLLALLLPGPLAYAQSLASPGLGELQATIRLLTYNVFGVSAPFGENEICDVRYSRFGEILRRRNPVADVIGLQEYFGNNILGIPIGSCDPDELREAITATGRYLTNEQHPCVPLLLAFPPHVNGCRFHPKEGIDGGVGLLTEHHIEAAASWRWDDHGDQDRSQGFLFARIRLADTVSGAPLRLDVYIVHVLGECSLPCRRRELEQLARKISELSGQSGNPVFVMGDFNLSGPLSRSDLANVDSEFPGYRHILDTLGNPRDIWLEAHPDLAVLERGFTGDECPIVRSADDSPELELNSLQCSGSTPPCGCRGRRIDYLLLINDPQLTNNEFEVRFAHPDNVRNLRFFRRDDGPGIADGVVIPGPIRISVSDHYGVDAILEIRKPAEFAPIDPIP